jgi:hypothetical protein
MSNFNIIDFITLAVQVSSSHVHLCNFLLQLSPLGQYIPLVTFFHLPSDFDFPLNWEPSYAPVLKWVGLYFFSLSVIFRMKM